MANATITRPTGDGLTLPSASNRDIIYEHWEWVTNIKTFLEGTNMNRENVDTSSSNGIMSLDEAQTATEKKTWVANDAAAAGVVEVARFGLNPASGTPAANDGGRIALFADDAGGGDSNIAYIDWVMTTATAGSEVGRLDLYVAAGGAPVSQIQVLDGSLIPTTDSDVSLGITGTRWSNFFTDAATVGGALASGSIAAGGDITIANTYGLVVGGTAQQTISDGGGATDVVPEVQVLGTATADMTALIGGWSTTATRAAAPTLALLKSGNATIASHTVVTDGEILGSIIAYGDDGTDYESPAAAIEFAVDGTPGTGDMPGEIKFYTTADSGETLTLALTLSAAQAATFAGAVTVASLACTAEGTFGGGYGATGATISTAGVIQANGAITSDGAVTGATLAGTISTATQNSITTATSLASVGTITTGTWSGVIDGSCTMTLGSDATGDIYYRDASGFLEKLAASTDGHVLTSTGAGSIPAWEAAASGGAALTGSTNNTITTVTGADAIQGEANLTFDGTTLDVVGNAGVGIARTDGTFHVNTASAGAITFDSNLDDLIIENSGHGGLTVAVPDASLGYLGWQSPSSTAGHNQFTWSYNSGVEQIVAYCAGGGIMSWNAGGLVGINETLNASVTTGLTINQGANDNEIFTLKSSDVAHGYTSQSETDTYFNIIKGLDPAAGGVFLRTLTENTAITKTMGLDSRGGTATTTQTTAASGLMDFYVAQHNGSNAVAGLTSNGVAFTFACRNNAGSDVSIFLIDEDGDFLYDGADGGAFDSVEELGGAVHDVSLCRAFDLQISSEKSLIKTRWDDFVCYNKDDLVKAGILGYCSPEDEAKGERGLVSGRQLARLHNGAIWQTHVEVQELKEVYENRIALLEQRLNLLEN